ncbi:hypothetical protein Anapl_15255 [Anas platyrhynchos]|uniref:Uncharacterized protein n=1 Tax=Anas platyrhynchos TaxID=8839 RepID=R0LHB0_ANAPL|nr:hypothetical protein Anapl_15255 [Anas platyrhynchos]
MLPGHLSKARPRSTSCPAGSRLHLHSTRAGPSEAAPVCPARLRASPSPAVVLPTQLQLLVAAGPNPPGAPEDMALPVPTSPTSMCRPKPQRGPRPCNPTDDRSSFASGADAASSRARGKGRKTAPNVLRWRWGPESHLPTARACRQQGSKAQPRVLLPGRSPERGGQQGHEQGSWGGPTPPGAPLAQWPYTPWRAGRCPRLSRRQQISG